MILKDSQENEVVVHIYGTSEDDVQIDEAYYVDDEMPYEVPEDEIEYIMDTYQAELVESWHEKQRELAEDWRDRNMDR